MTRIRSHTRRAPAFLALSLAAGAAAVLANGFDGPGPGAAADRYQAGQPAVERVRLTSSETAAIRSRGLDLAQALGLPVGPRAQAGRVVERFAGQALDEVVIADTAGRRSAIVRMHPDGRLASALRLGWVRRPARAISAQQAVTRAAGVAGAAELAISAEQPDLARDVDGGWRVSWARRVAGVPVAGDGVTVTLFADGSLHAAAARERPLAEAPAATIPLAAAERAAREHLASLLGAAAASARLEPARLVWVAPNDTFEPSAPDAPDPVLRLAWVTRAWTTGSLAGTLRALELYLDAGDGRLLGGDLLR